MATDLPFQIDGNSIHFPFADSGHSVRVDNWQTTAPRVSLVMGHGADPLAGDVDLRDPAARAAFVAPLNGGSDVAGRELALVAAAIAKLRPLASASPASSGPPSLPPRIWSATELMNADLPPPRWAVDDLLTEGLSILAARPKKGKSWLALCIAIAASRATPALGYFPVAAPSDVLYLALEDGPRRLQDRLRSLLGGGPAPPRLHFATEWPQLGNGAEEAFDSWLSEHPDASFLTIDTYQRLRPVANRSDDRYERDYTHAGRLKEIADRHHVALLIIHHTRKPVGGEDPLDEVLGSTGLTGAADSILVLRSEVGKADAVLYVRGRDLPEAEHALTQNRETGRWTRLGEAAEARRSSARQAILTAIASTGGKGLRPKEIAAATQQAGDNVRQLLVKMRESGEVVEHAGSYFVTATAPRPEPLSQPTFDHATDHAENGLARPIVTGVIGVIGVPVTTNESDPITVPDHSDHSDHKRPGEATNRVMAGVIERPRDHGQSQSNASTGEVPACCQARQACERLGPCNPRWCDRQNSDEGASQ